MSSSPPLVVADRYRLVAPLGQGGMGRVWRATDVVLHRDVAIKELVPPPGLTPDERREMRERSLREARAIARLNNVNVVRVFDVLRTDADPWIVMEYVPSRSLQDVLAADGPFNAVRAAEIGLGVLGALRAAHRAGVVHRDVKPGNVLMGEDGRVVLTDFGLATVPGDPNVTRTGLVLGSPAYIAPERARDGTAGPGADLWSLGATLYAAVEGASPFARPSAIATLAALATENPPPARNAGPLKPVLNGLLRKDPAHRINAEEAERLLLRATGRRSKLSFPMSPTMRRPGAGRERPSLPTGPGGPPVLPGATPTMPGPRPPAAQPTGPPAGDRPPVYVPGKATVGRQPAETPTRVDGPKVDAPRLDATRVDGPAVRGDTPAGVDKTTKLSGTPESRANTELTKTTRGEFGAFTAADVAAHRRKQAAPEHEKSLAEATSVTYVPNPPKPTETPSQRAGTSPDQTALVQPSPAQAARTRAAAAQAQEALAASVQAAQAEATRAEAARQEAARAAEARAAQEREAAERAAAARAAAEERAAAAKVAEERAAAAKVAEERAAAAKVAEERAAAVKTAQDRAAAAQAAEERAAAKAAEERAAAEAAAEEKAAQARAAEEKAAKDRAEQATKQEQAAKAKAAETALAETAAKTALAETAAAEAAEAGVAETAASEAAVAEEGQVETAVAQAAVAEAGQVETAVAEAAVTEAAAAEAAASEVEAARPEAAQSDSAQAETGLVGAALTVSAEVESAEAGSAETEPAQAGSARTDSAQVGVVSTEPEPGEAARTDSAQAASAQDDPAEASFTQADSAKAGSTQGELSEAGASSVGSVGGESGQVTEIDSAGEDAPKALDSTLSESVDDQAKVTGTAASAPPATGKSTAARKKAQSDRAKAAGERKSGTASARAAKREEAPAQVALPLARPKRGADATRVVDPVGAAPDDGDTAGGLAPLPGINRSSRPAWKPMEVRSAPAPTGGITVFGTRLTYRQAGVGAGVLLLVLVMVIVLAARGFGSDDRDAAGPVVPTAATAKPTAAATPSTVPSSPAASATTPSSAPASTPPSSAPPVSSAPPAAALPPGMSLYRDSTGFAVPIWTGASITRSGSEVYFRKNNRLLIVDQTITPQADPLQDWKNQEAARAGQYRNYNKIKLESVKYFQSSADWEFTYTTDSGNPQHAVKRNILVNDHQAYSLSWYTSPADWAASQTELQAIYRGFQPKK